MLPHVQESMRRGKEDHWDFLLAIMDDPKALLESRRHLLAGSGRQLYGLP